MDISYPIPMPMGPTNQFNQLNQAQEHTNSQLYDLKKAYNSFYSLLKRINPEVNEYLEEIELKPLAEKSKVDNREKPRGLDITTLKLFRVGSGYEIFKDDEEKNMKYMCVYFPLFNVMSKKKQEQRQNG